MIARSAGGTVAFNGVSVIIRRAETVRFVLHGLSADSNIPIFDIKAVIFRPARVNGRGYLKIATDSSPRAPRGAVTAAGGENSILFDWADQRQFKALATAIRKSVQGAAVESLTVSDRGVVTAVAVAARPMKTVSPPSEPPVRRSSFRDRAPSAAPPMAAPSIAHDRDRLAPKSDAREMRRAFVERWDK